MAKKCEIIIEYCNSMCPHFYHKYSDYENIYCGKLDKKIFDYDGETIMFDYSARKIPDECILEDI